MAEHNILGEQGEQKACDYLLTNGYEILARNWHFGKDELDIICLHSGYLVIVEVKTRQSDYFERPEDAVTRGKIKRIVNATQGYIETYNCQNEVRFDVISLIFDTKLGWQMEHFIDAFMAPVNK